MGAPQYEQAGADIGGSGTANTIPRWTGASTLGDSIITQTGSTRITVGSGAYAGASLDGVRLTNGVNSYFAASDGTRTMFMGADGNAVVGTLTAHDLKIRAGNADAITVQQGTLNVGIGTASPASYISASSTVLAVASPGGNLGTVRVSNTSSFASGNQAEFFASTTAVGLWGSTNCPMLFYTNSTERARIDSNGNIYGTSGTTGMTNGFFYIPAAAGAPTGTPTAVSGRVPMYYDTTNNQFYVYNGAWKKVTLA